MLASNATIGSRASGEYGGEDRCRSFAGYQIAPLIDGIRKSSGGEREQEQWQCVGNLDERNEEDTGRKIRHQPARGGAIHP
jgi:hypothetical protein